ncbi:MAG: MoxR family ATPase [Gammaproteobacteria bacterium]|nr:MoxR family ATPase [Gammaproteobacteria bacterium]
MDILNRQLHTPLAIYQALFSNIEKVITGKHKAIRLCLGAFASGVHVLLEDVPGTGKTTLAKALARSVDANFQRIQFTPDLLPSDILGVNMFRQSDQAFHFLKGPIFSSILLSDEINRASPRTQSALLEAMAENQVSIDGVRHQLDEMFFVIATQNPVESHGTYPLPEAQMDRFGIRFTLGYVSPQEEVDILEAQNNQHPLDELKSCASAADAALLRKAVLQVRVSEEIKRYIVDLVGATRSCKGVRLGASPRASLTLMRLSQALALFDGADFVTPDQIQEAAIPVIAHRLTIDPEAKFSGASASAIVEEIVDRLPVPT